MPLDFTRMDAAVAEVDAAYAQLKSQAGTTTTPPPGTTTTAPPATTTTPPPTTTAAPGGGISDLPASVQPFVVASWRGPTYSNPTVTLPAQGMNVFTLGTTRNSSDTNQTIIDFGGKFRFFVEGRGPNTQFEFMDIDTYVWIDTGPGQHVIEFSTDPSGVGVTAFLDDVNVNNHVQRFIDPAGAKGITAFNVTPYLADYTIITRSDISAQAKNDLRAYLRSKKSGGTTTTQPPSTTQPPGTTQPPSTTQPPATTTPAPTGTTQPPATTTPAPTPAGSHFLQLTSPVKTGPSADTRLFVNKGYVVSVDPTTWNISPGTYTFTGKAPGMRNLAVIDNNGGWHTIVDAGSSLDVATGNFTVANVPIADREGPTAINVYAWNSPPGDGNFTESLTLRAELFVPNGNPARPTGLPAGVPAMPLVFEEDFKGPLSAATTDAVTAKFWQGAGKPSTWEAGNGGEYSDVANVTSQDPRKPFTVFPNGNGYLRIRDTYDPNLIDQNGWGRTFWGSGLSTGFPGGGTSVSFRKGYAEMRAATATGGSAWNSFWLVDVQSIVQANSSLGAVEIDVLEQYGSNPTTYQNALHNWPNDNPNNGPQNLHISNWVDAGVDMGMSMHTWGIQLTDTEIVWYFEQKEVWRQPFPREKGPYYIMIHPSLGGGQGWPTPVHPSGFYDMFVDYLRVWKLA
jgi:hypothetical protein